MFLFVSFLLLDKNMFFLSLHLLSIYTPSHYIFPVGRKGNGVEVRKNRTVADLHWTGHASPSTVQHCPEPTSLVEGHNVDVQEVKVQAPATPRRKESSLRRCAGMVLCLPTLSHFQINPLVLFPSLLSKLDFNPLLPALKQNLTNLFIFA